MHIKNLPPVDEQKDNTYLQDRLDQMQILFPTKARLLGMHWDDQSDWNKLFRSLDWEEKQVNLVKSAR